MKKILLTLTLLICVSSSLIAFAHSGRTDGSGGHYDNDAGEYHYHHGYSAHKHTNGVCPYDSDYASSHSAKLEKNKTTTTQTTTKNTSQATTQSSTEKNSKNTLKTFIKEHPNITLFIIMLLCAFITYIIEKIL